MADEVHLGLYGTVYNEAVYKQFQFKEQNWSSNLKAGGILIPV